MWPGHLGRGTLLSPSRASTISGTQPPSSAFVSDGDKGVQGGRELYDPDTQCLNRGLWTTATEPEGRALGGTESELASSRHSLWSFP